MEEEPEKSTNYGLWTIEINLDKDYADACSWHIDTFKATSAQNIRSAVEKKNVSNWAIVGLAHSLYQANEKAKKLREVLCEMHGRTMTGIPFEGVNE